MRRRCATVATPGEWQCKTGGVRRLAVANGPNIFQMLLVFYACVHYVAMENSKESTRCANKKKQSLEKMLYFSHGSMDLSQTFRLFM